MYNVLIVEDDTTAANTLCSYLARFGEQHGIGFTARVLTDAEQLLSGHHEADVMFLDIGLPGINGMDAAELIRQNNNEIPIIFVTDLVQFVIRGYTVGALDFMVKPVPYDDFALRMGRAIRIIERNTGSAITIASPNGLRIIRTRSIMYVEVLSHNLHWHIAGETNLIRQRGSLSALTEQLARLGETSFCRISASHLINMGQIHLIRPDSVIMNDGTTITITRTYKQQALETINRYIGGSI